MSRKNSRRKNKSRSSRVALHALMHPARLKLPNHPTEVNLTPWNSITAVILGTALSGTGATKLLSIGVISNAVLNQILAVLTPPTLASSLVFRIKSCRVWGPVPVKTTPLRVSFFDIFDDNVTPTATANGVLQRCVDYADAVNRARVGFRYSVAQQNYAIIGNTQGVQPIASISAGVADDLNSVVVYVDLLWRFSNFVDAVDLTGPESLSVEDLTVLPEQTATRVGLRPGEAVPGKLSGKGWFQY